MTLSDFNWSPPPPSPLLQFLKPVYLKQTRHSGWWPDCAYHSDTYLVFLGGNLGPDHYLREQGDPQPSGGCVMIWGSLQKTGTEDLYLIGLKPQGMKGLEGGGLQSVEVL